jgi:hypothetical protein
MSFSLAYPVTARSTVWTPSKDPLLGSAINENTGIQASRAADGVTQYANRFAPAFDGYVYNFSGLSEADRLNLKAFALTAGGARFEFTEGGCGLLTGWQTAKFAVEGFKRTWTRQSGGLWAVTIALVDA